MFFKYECFERVFKVIDRVSLFHMRCNEHKYNVLSEVHEIIMAFRQISLQGSDISIMSIINLLGTSLFKHCFDIITLRRTIFHTLWSWCVRDSVNLEEDPYRPLVLIAAGFPRGLLWENSVIPISQPSINLITWQESQCRRMQSRCELLRVQTPSSLPLLFSISVWI